jgi:hypothetical protein
LRRLRAPQEAQAQERAWAVVQAAYAGRAARPRRRSRTSLLLVPAVIVASILALTPAAATVHRWIDRTLTVTHPRPELFSLPAPGRILVSGAGGIWTVSADGSRHRIGTAADAAWSPHGLYVVVASRDELSALTPGGTPVWSVARPDVRAPRWFAPNGYRIAYLSGATVRVIAGDGTEDRLLAAAVARVAPAWQPEHPYRLAYVARPARLVVRDADSGRIVWARSLPSAPKLLSWSADGSDLLALTPGAALVFDGAGRLRSRVVAATGSWRSGALSPDGAEVALVDGRTLSLTDLRATPARAHTLFTGAGVGQLAFSPDGTWVLVSWPAADQWVFVRAHGAPRISAASGIARQFGASAFPSLDGWCCTRVSGTG